MKRIFMTSCIHPFPLEYILTFAFMHKEPPLSPISNKCDEYHGISAGMEVQKVGDLKEKYLLQLVIIIMPHRVTCSFRATIKGSRLFGNMVVRKLRMRRDQCVIPHYCTKDPQVGEINRKYNFCDNKKIGVYMCVLCAS